MRMASYHLVADRFRDVGETEQIRLFRHAGMVDHLEQQISKFIRQGCKVPIRDRIRDLVRLLDRVRCDCVEGLNLVPAAAALGVAQTGHDVEQAAKFGGVSVLGHVQRIGVSPGGVQAGGSRISVH